MTAPVRVAIMPKRGEPERPLSLREAEAAQRVIAATCARAGVDVEGVSIVDTTEHLNCQCTHLGHTLLRPADSFREVLLERGYVYAPNVARATVDRHNQLLARNRSVAGNLDLGCFSTVRVRHGKPWYVCFIYRGVVRFPGTIVSIDEHDNWPGWAVEE